MTKDEARKEATKLYNMMKNRKATDKWHRAINGRISALFDWAVSSNGKDPGPWEMPPVPEGVEP